MNATIHARLDAYWAKVSQTAPDDLASPTLVVPHGPALGDYSGLYVVVRQNRVMVSAPPLVTSVNYWALFPRVGMTRSGEPLYDLTGWMWVPIKSAEPDAPPASGSSLA